jgi:hypothetical protein
MRRTFIAVALIAALFTQGAISQLFVFCHSGEKTAIEVIGHQECCSHHHEDSAKTEHCDEDPGCTDSALYDDALVQRSLDLPLSLSYLNLPIKYSLPPELFLAKTWAETITRPRGPPDTPPSSLRLRTCILLI